MRPIVLIIFTKCIFSVEFLNFFTLFQCFSYMQECNPDKNECCGDLKCLNYLQGYCLYPLENCWCTTGRMYNTDNA